MSSQALWSASIQGGALVMIVWLAIRIMPSLPATAKVWLWRLVFLKFALGFFGIGNLPLPLLPTRPAGLAQPNQLATTEVVPSDRVATEPAALQTAVAEVAAPEPKSDPVNWPLVLWLGGIALVAGVAISGSVKTYGIVRRAERIDDVWLQGAMDDLVRRAGLRATPNLLRSLETKSAFVAWGVRPSIVLPSTEDISDVKLVLAHEVAHLAHQDLLWNLLSSAVKTVFFFHPLVWVSSMRSHIAQESAADERAIRLAGASNKAYGEMLLRLTTAGRRLQSVPGAAAISGSVRLLQERLDAIGRSGRKPALAWRLATFAVIALMLPGYRLVAQTKYAKAKQLSPMSEDMPKGVKTSAAFMNLRTGQLSLEGTAMSDSALIDYLEALGKDKRIQDVRLTYASKQRSRSGLLVHFTVTAKTVDGKGGNRMLTPVPDRPNLGAPTTRPPLQRQPLAPVAPDRRSSTGAPGRSPLARSVPGLVRSSGDARVAPVAPQGKSRGVAPGRPPLAPASPGSGMVPVLKRAIRANSIEPVVPADPLKGHSPSMTAGSNSPVSKAALIPAEPSVRPTGKGVAPAIAHGVPRGLTPVAVPAPAVAVPARDQGNKSGTEPSIAQPAKVAEGAPKATVTRDLTVIRQIAPRKGGSKEPVIVTQVSGKSVTVRSSATSSKSKSIKVVRQKALKTGPLVEFVWDGKKYVARSKATVRAKKGKGSTVSEAKSTKG